MSYFQLVPMHEFQMVSNEFASNDVLKIPYKKIIWKGITVSATNSDLGMGEFVTETQLLCSIGSFVSGVCIPLYELCVCVG